MSPNSEQELPFISIVIPTFNRKEALCRCLKSLCDLDYPRERYEIIIVDDGSDDGTGGSLSGRQGPDNRRIKYLRNEHNRGAAASRNRGFSRAAGEFIVSLDDDCRVGKSWLKDMVETFGSFPAASAVGGSVVNPAASALAQASHILEFSSWLPLGSIRPVNDIPTCNIAYKRSAIKGLVFPEGFKDSVYEDTLFNRYLLKAGGVIIFNPGIKVYHYKWTQDFTKDDFYKSQSRYATGFLRGGFKAHGFWGVFLVRHKALNLLCPRLVLVFFRCARSKDYLLQFIRNFGLILSGEWHRNKMIYRGLN